MRYVSALLAIALLCCGLRALPVYANTSNPAYCTPPNALAPGAKVQASPLNQNFQHAETCSGQPGDFFTDGPVYDASAGTAGLSFTIPSNVWYVIGARVFVAQVTYAVPPSSTSYWWLDNSTGQWSMSLSAMPPNGTSTLGYTVVADNTGIDSVTPAPPAMATFANLNIGTLSVTGTLNLPATITVVSLVANAPGTTPPVMLASGDVDAAESNTTGQIFLGGVGADCALDFGISATNTLTTSCPVTVNGALGAKALRQTATNQFAGTCTNSTGTTCTLTLANSYTSPLCFAVDRAPLPIAILATCSVTGNVATVTNAEGSDAGICNFFSSSTCTLTEPYSFGASSWCISQLSVSPGTKGICSLSGTTLTLSASVSNSLAWNWLLHGTPTATGHSFSVFVVGNPN